MTATASTTVRARLRAGRAGDLLGGGGRHHQEGEDQQRPGDLADLGGGAPEEHEEDDGQRPDRHTAGPGHIGVDRGEEQRAADEGQSDQNAQPHQGQRHHLAVGDPEERAEQQPGEAGEEATVQADDRIPQARAKACTVPITADSSLRARPEVERGTMAMTSAAAMLPAK